MTHFSKSIAEEYGDKLDIMVATAGPTKSNMNKGVVFCASYPESVASHTLNTLGHETHTFGDFRHGLRDYLLNRKIQGSIVRYIDSKRIAALSKK